MPLDHFVTLGRSGLKVSPLCLGTMTFGEEWGFGVGAEESARMMEFYLDLGGNFIDTANMYTDGHSEAIIGDFFATTPGRRDSIVLATKFSGSPRFSDPNAGGAGRKAIIAACENSLRRLRTDYIDLYWLHWSDPFTPIDETMEAMNDLVRTGKVRYLGFSDTPAWRCAQAQVMAQFRNWAPLIALQIEYSLLERTVEGELVPMARELGMGVTPWSPLGAGALSGKYTRENRVAVSAGRSTSLSARLNDRAFDIIDVVRAVAEELDSTPARVALAWVLSRSGVASPIIGARTIEQFHDNIKALDLELTADQSDRLNAVSKPALNFPANMGLGLVAASYGGITINGQNIRAGFRTVGQQTKIW